VIVADAIEITDIVLSPLSSEEITPTMARLPFDWYTLDVSVTNRSETTLYVISEIRNLRYEAERRLLVLELSEREPPESRRLRPVRPSSWVVVEPSERATLTNRLSSPLTWIEETPAGERRPLHVSLTEDVDMIECVAGYSADEPPPAFDLTATESPPAHSWVTVRTTTLLR